jgi:hypothetical protein
MTDAQALLAQGAVVIFAAARVCVNTMRITLIATDERASDRFI